MVSPHHPSQKEKCWTNQTPEHAQSSGSVGTPRDSSVSIDAVREWEIKRIREFSATFAIHA